MISLTPISAHATDRRYPPQAGAARRRHRGRRRPVRWPRAPPVPQAVARPARRAHPATRWRKSPAYYARHPSVGVPPAPGVGSPQAWVAWCGQPGGRSSRRVKPSRIPCAARAAGTSRRSAELSVVGSGARPSPRRGVFRRRLRRHGEAVDPPSRLGHRPVEFGREPPRGLHPAGPRPQPAGEMSGQEVEQKLALQLVEAAVQRRVAVIWRSIPPPAPGRFR